MKAFSHILFVLAGLMILVPYPAFVYLIKTYASKSGDPDAIEAVAWFAGALLMLIGAFLIPVALGVWKYARKSSVVDRVAINRI